MASRYAQLPGQSRVFPQGPHSTSSLVSQSSSNPFSDQQSVNSISGKFNLSPDPRAWGTVVGAEDDDWLHDPKKGKGINDRGTIFTARGLQNVGCLAILALGLTTLFAGYPIINYFTRPKQTNLGGYNLGGINATGQVNQLAFNMIDPDTPADALTKASIDDPSQELQLVFSDEFNKEGRSFYPGDDPFWEAVDLWYWPTNDLEWYDPEQVTTTNGYLKLTIEQRNVHNMSYVSGMVTTWNKFCFTGGMIEAAVSLPGRPDTSGFWPAVWTMGNLGRAGYGASSDGLWPYTYEACDIGTVANQSINGSPAAASTGNREDYNYALSFLPGQRLSACTCPGEPHPGPVYQDGTFVGRSAPEIDVLEAQVNMTYFTGEVSQSVQFAPFDANYAWFNNTPNLEIVDPTVSYVNTYQGSVLQQTGSIVSKANDNCYTGETGCFAVYGFEYKPGYEADGGYVTWINDNKKAWTFNAAGIGADADTQISARPVPKEPMYILVNLGLSDGFSPISADLTYPSEMHVDYIRVYQPKNAINYGCDPQGFPTSNYINQYIEAYTNPNLTSWQGDYGQPWPKNKFLNQC